MITITDINGSRNFLLSQIIKRLLVYFLIFVVFVVTASILYLKYLNSKIEYMTHARELLLDQNDELQLKISAAKAEFEAIDGKISDLEIQFGLSQDSNKSIINRIVNVTLSSMEERAVFSQIPNASPVNYSRITDPFGWRDHPILNRKEMHPGIDLKTQKNTPVFAPADGVVEFFGNRNGYGNMLEIRHNFGFSTRYGHLDAKKVVSAGDFVKKGDLIAYTGNTGLSTGPHLHYEIRFVQRPLDPIHFMKWKSENYKEIFEKEQSIQWQSLIKMLSTQAIKQQ